MLVRCPDCTTKYEIAASLIPENGVKVRCPKCKAVFAVSKSEGENGGRQPAPDPIAGEIGPKPRAWVESAPQPKGVVAMARSKPQVQDPPRKKKKITDPKTAERLARAVMQEVLYGRDAERRQALEEGRALSVFGAAVAEAFAVYERRVSGDLPGAKAVFRNAVNSILGEGRDLL